MPNLGTQRLTDAAVLTKGLWLKQFIMLWSIAFFLKQNEFNDNALSNTVTPFLALFCYCFACGMRKKLATAFDRALLLPLTRYLLVNYEKVFKLGMTSKKKNHKKSDHWIVLHLGNTYILTEIH